VHSVATSERRKGVRVVFEKGFEVSIMAIDGTWRRDCIMQDVSETGARLSIRDSIEGLKLKEFFLLLSSTGLTYRRARLGQRRRNWREIRNSTDRKEKNEFSEAIVVISRFE
jgi:hypothetical protein